MMNSTVNTGSYLSQDKVHFILRCDVPIARHVNTICGVVCAVALFALVGGCACRESRVGMLRDSSRQQKEFVAAAYDGDMDTVRRLVEYGVDVNGIYGRGGMTRFNNVLGDSWTGLHAACAAQQVEIVRLLLSRGGNPNVEDYCGNTPLLLAVDVYDRTMDYSAIPIMLLAAGADPNIPSRDLADAIQDTALHRAVTWNQLATVEALLRAGAAVNARDRRGRTPLYLARSLPVSDKVVTRLVDAGGQ